MTARWLTMDVFDGLATLDDGSVDLVITSPPFLALRSYLPADHPDKAKEIGSEPTPAAFIDVLLAVTAELRRVLAPHGSICVELGDTYAGSGGAGGDYGEGGWREYQNAYGGTGKLARYSDDRGNPDGMRDPTFSGGNTLTGSGQGWPLAKSKTLIPELYRLALAYGVNPLTGQPSPAGRWRVRNVVTWCRPNPPVGALGDKWRPATSDIVIACTSDKRYWDDIATRHHNHPERIAEGSSPHKARMGGMEGIKGAGSDADPDYRPNREDRPWNGAGAPLLDYWEIPPGGYPGSHYAVYPPALVEPLVKAMAPPKVCQTCGEPSRRIVASEQLDTGRTTNGSKNIGRKHESPTDFETRTLSQHSTLGWTVCGCGPNCRPTTFTTIEIVDDNGERKKIRVVDDPGLCLDPSHWRPAHVLDPFAGSGTTLAVATGHGHDATGIDLDPRNADLARERIGPLLFDEVEL